MNLNKKITEEICELTQKELQYMAKLVCLLRYCPGFNEELKQHVPDGCKKVSSEQLVAVDNLMNKWLREKGWAEILRPELESVGVMV